MSERERWIVYPLLFLALGASLRDKIIKTTDSQRIKTQGLYVYEENGSTTQPVLVLGADQFPDLPNRKLDELAMDSVNAIRMKAGALSAEVISTTQLQSKNIQAAGSINTIRSRANVVEADHVVAKNLTLTDGQRRVTLQGTNALIQILSLLQQQEAQDPVDGDQDQATVGAPTLPSVDDPPEQSEPDKAVEPPKASEQPTSVADGIEEPKAD